MNTLRLLNSRPEAFVSGMIRHYPALAVLRTFSEGETSLVAARKTRLLESFLRRFEGLPASLRADQKQLETAWNNAEPSVQMERAHKRGTWCAEVIAQYEDEADRLFLTRCAAVLIELYGIACAGLPLAAV